MHTNTPNGNKFKMADGSTMHRNGILAKKKDKDAIIASGTFGTTTIHSPTLIKHGSSLITIDGDGDHAQIYVEPFDIAMIKASHLTHKFGQAKIARSSKA